MARTLEVFVPVSIGKKRGKRAGETFYLLQGSFLLWRNGGFYSFALRTSAAATIKSRRSIKRQATNFRRLGRTSTSRGGERRRMWKKAPFTELTESTRGYLVSRGKRSKIFPYVRNLALHGVSDYRPFRCDDWNI